MLARGESIDIAEELAAFSGDPLGFVMFAFPWGEAGTALEFKEGPEPWQRALLIRLGEGLDFDAAIREATVSGNGVGKSACVSWIILWAVSTFEDTKGVITANTENQLKTKTWAELGKWYNLFIGKELFTLTATALIAKDPDRQLTWRVDMIAWSEKNVAAFQGLHNEGKRLFMIFDEASGIPDAIWEAGDGCMTDKNTQRIWCVFGNPNNASGRFRECAPGGKFAHRWHCTSVDSRTISFTDKAESQQWVDDYGEDSDFVRVRVRGVFPRVGTIQFIGSDDVDEAFKREVSINLHDPLVLGVDVARFGDNKSVIFVRKGRDCRTIAPRVFVGVDTMTLAGHVAGMVRELRADAVFVDGGGVGGGVVDRLRQLNVSCWDIQFGGKSDNPPTDEKIKYANKRSEMWGHLRREIKHLALGNDSELRDEITAPQYGFNNADEIQLESKESMRKRGVVSPDKADALALTFAYSVLASLAPSAYGQGGGSPGFASEYDPLTHHEREPA